MSQKQTGYEFWRALKSPQFVAAPMVDMSELSFRMLCRRYKAQLCFSPMLHSQQFLQDILYRSDTFSTCSEDNPLIVQFCSNDPFDFINAASLVSSQCSAVDLNLGCPQAIARKGFYGAFLQNDWDLIHSIVRKASAELPVPITCKMRILPGDFRHSVEYAKMLEESGCSVLTVHGRTREQKGHATGLASWEVIKEIKANVHIPVIANGNILSFRDVKECLRYTQADAVMSAEALLHNPALFSESNPPVWLIVHQYLQYAEKYNTPIRCVRCHLFKILYLCIHQDNRIQEILADGKTYADFYGVCDLLKFLPKAASEVSSKTDSNIEGDDCLIEASNTEPELKHLPIWLCHSRPRLVDEENVTRGCYSKYFEPVSILSNAGEKEIFLSKKKLRKLRHHEKVVAAKKEKRKSQKMRRKLKKLSEMRITQDTETVSTEERLKVTKKEKKMLIRERLLKAQEFAPKVCINLGFSSQMEIKDLTRLSSQLRRLYGSNRHSLYPLHLYFCNFCTTDSLYQICLDKNDGFATYVVDMCEKSPEEMFDVKDIIYLSPESENVLQIVDPQKVYVIGGIVDGTVKKGLSLNHAREWNVETARLPIPEYLVKCSQNPGSTVLTVNQVFDILLKYYETRDWTLALSSNVPPRKGYCAPSSTTLLIS